MPGRDLPSLECHPHVRGGGARAQLHARRGTAARDAGRGQQADQAPLGKPLFRRVGRQLELTEAGEAYRAIVDEALQAIRRGTARIRQQGRAPTLTLSVLPSFAARWLIPRLQLYQAQHPELNIWLGASYDAVDFDRDTDIDAGIRFGRGRWPGVHVESPVEERVAPVCTADIAAKLVRPRDVLRFKIFGDRPPWDEWQPWLRSQGVDVVPDELGLSSDFSVILQAAAEGQGVAMARDLLVADDLKAGRLVRPFAHGITSRFNYYFVCAPHRAEEPELRRFVSWLRAAMAETIAACWAQPA